MDESGLLAAARSVMGRAHAPYSRYRVGAALLCADGDVVLGCNVENVSYGLTICAERAAVARAVAEGKRDFEAIAIVTDGSDAITPCGACRQVLAEFAPDVNVFSEGVSERRSWTLRELLPDAFDAPLEWGSKDENR